jgi:uncharacterized protein with PQ loop repeat
MLKYLQKFKNNKLAITTLFFALVFICVGLPSQIIRIWETHSVKGVSVITFFLLATQAVFWVFYGRQRKDLVVIVVNLFGTLFATVIVLEYLMFH